MSLSDKHRTMLRLLAGYCAQHDTFDVVSEWLGYLPFGVYVWVEGVEFPEPWDSADIDLLVSEGYLERISYEVYDEDGFDSRGRYRLVKPLDQTFPQPE